jgi:RNA polymerase sigma factor (sigma-70 family)
MDQTQQLVERFEEHRPRLRMVAYRMLGSLSEADDAVQETWLRASRADTSRVENPGGWLTTVVGRVCLDLLRARTARREEPLDMRVADPVAGGADGADPEHDAVLADSVGRALLVVLDTLAPAERIAYVLHDMFAVPFDDIAPVVGRNPAAARKLASRARRRVRTPPSVPHPDPRRQREAVEAFLAATRAGDFDGLLAVLDPDVEVRADAAAAPAGAPRRVQGAAAVAEQALTYSKQAGHARLALVNGAPGIVVSSHDRPVTVIAFTIHNRRIHTIDILADPARLHLLDLAVLN